MNTLEGAFNIRGASAMSLLHHHIPLSRLDLLDRKILVLIDESCKSPSVDAKLRSLISFLENRGVKKILMISDIEEEFIDPSSCQFCVYSQITYSCLDCVCEDEDCLAMEMGQYSYAFNLSNSAIAVQTVIKLLENGGTCYVMSPYQSSQSVNISSVIRPQIDFVGMSIDELDIEV
jgi:hypothetical protein